jgi:UDP-3-O-[3-hydroxymyristoyl] glucosamine N-acyltransferase
MYRLSEVALDRAAVLRDAEFARTCYAFAKTGPVLACAADAHHLDVALHGGAATALIVPAELAAAVPEPLGVLVAEDPEIAFYMLHNALARDHGMRVRVESFVDPSASIHPEAFVEPGCRIGPGVVIEARAVIHRGTVLEEGARVGSAALVGCDGRVTRRRPGLALQAAHVGGVRVGPEAIIFPGVAIQRAIFAHFTEIGARTMVTTGTTIYHGASIGVDSTISGGTIILGYSNIGDRVWVGPGAIISNLIEIGDDARVELGAVVVRSIPSGARYSGLFARPHDMMRRMSLALADLARRG